MKNLHFLFSMSFLMLSILVTSNIADIQACTPYENCSRTTNSTIVQTASFSGNHGTYAIPYNMTNGILVASILDLPAKELIFTLNATGDGKLTVELPRKIIDSTRDGKDTQYLVFVGTRETVPKRINANEIYNDNQTRTLVIDFTKKDNQIGIVGTWFIENNSTYTSRNPFGSFTPLQQYNKGFDAQDIVCKQGLQLVIKNEDKTPACVTPETRTKLVERGWGFYAISNSTQKQISEILPSQPDKITGLENDTGMVTLGNKTYYFETPNYYAEIDDNPVQTLFFHNVVFTLPPQSGEKSLIDGCERKDYWTVAKFSDGTSELLHIFVDSQPCSVHFPSADFSTHANPQAGLTFYEGKMKLLVSTSVTNSVGVRK